MVQPCYNAVMRGLEVLFIGFDSMLVNKVVRSVRRSRKLSPCSGALGTMADLVAMNVVRINL
jgi:hypothetical protein